MSICRGQVVGSLLIGIYATTEANPDGPDGMLAGGGLDSLIAQTIGVAVSAAWAAIGTWLVMKAIGIGLGSARITREDEKHGIDKVSHREQSCARCPVSIPRPLGHSPALPINLWASRCCNSELTRSRPTLADLNLHTLI